MGDKKKETVQSFCMNTASKKSLLFVNGHLNVGGIERSLIDLLKALDYSEFEVDLLLLEGLGTYVNEVPAAVKILSINREYVDGPLINTLAKSIIRGKLKELLCRIVLLLSSIFGERMLNLLGYTTGIRKRYDCAIAYRPGPSNQFVSIVVNSRRKICWWHNGECNYSSSEINTIARYWQNYYRVVAVSRATSELVQKSFFLPERKVSIIPNIIDVVNLERLAGSTNPYLHNNVKIITLGRLCWEKHIEDVPLIARRLIDFGVHFKWYIIGDGAKKEEIKALIEEKDVADNVVMLGSQSNPYPYVKYADIMMHTSHIEAHCITILEAMALKLPVVATRTELPQDYIKDGENCLLAEQSIESQADCIIKMVSDSQMSKLLVENAYSMVTSEYSPEMIVSKVEILVS